jgi:hypothetical protein
MYKHLVQHHTTNYTSKTTQFWGYEKLLRGEIQVMNLYITGTREGARSASKVCDVEVKVAGRGNAC